MVWGRSRARFDCESIWFSHNLELVGLALIIKTCGFHTMWNSSRRSWARFECKNMWFLHNSELVTEATEAMDATEVVASSAAQGLPSTRAGGEDDVR